MAQAADQFRPRTIFELAVQTVMLNGQNTSAKGYYQP